MQEVFQQRPRHQTERGQQQAFQTQFCGAEKAEPNGQHQYPDNVEGDIGPVYELTVFELEERHVDLEMCIRDSFGVGDDREAWVVQRLLREQ